MPKKPASKNDVPATGIIVPGAAGEKSAKDSREAKKPSTPNTPASKEPTTSAPVADTAQPVVAKESKPESPATQSEAAKTPDLDAPANPTPAGGVDQAAVKKPSAAIPGKPVARSPKRPVAKTPQEHGKKTAAPVAGAKSPQQVQDPQSGDKSGAASGKKPAGAKPVSSTPKTSTGPTPMAKPAFTPGQADSTKTSTAPATPDAARIGNPNKLSAPSPGAATVPSKQPGVKEPPHARTDSAGTKSRSSQAAPTSVTDPKPAATSASAANRPNGGESAAGVVTEKQVAPATSKAAAETKEAVKSPPSSATVTESAAPANKDASGLRVDEPVAPAPTKQPATGRTHGRVSKRAPRGMMVALMIVSFILEVALLGAVAMWGLAMLPLSPIMAIIVTVVPLLILWAIFMSPKASLRLPQPYHAVIAHVLFAVGAGLLAISGQPTLAIAMGALIAISLALTVAVRGANIAGPPNGTGRRAAR